MPHPRELRTPNIAESRGVAMLLSEYLGCREGDALVVAYGSGCELAVKWIGATAALNEISVSIFCTDGLDSVEFVGEPLIRPRPNFQNPMTFPIYGKDGSISPI